MDGVRGKVYPSRAEGGAGRGTPAGGHDDRAGLPDCADAARWRPAVGAVAPPRGRGPRSTPVPGSRTRRCRTPCRTLPRGTGACATLRRGPSPRPGCRVRLVRECRWNGGRAAISGRATACRRGARTACAAPHRSGPDTGDLGDGRVSRARSAAETHTRRHAACPRRRGAHRGTRLRSGRVRDGETPIGPRRYQRTVARPMAPVLAPPCRGSSRRCASTPSSTSRASRWLSIPRR